MLNHSPNGKGMVYGLNGKRIMVSMEFTLIIYSPNEKGMVLWNIVSPSGDRHGERLKKDVLWKIKCQSKLVLCITGITLRGQE